MTLNEAEAKVQAGFPYERIDRSKRAAQRLRFDVIQLGSQVMRDAASTVPSAPIIDPTTGGANAIGTIVTDADIAWIPVVLLYAASLVAVVFLERGVVAVVDQWIPNHRSGTLQRGPG
jgi:hypothetical protein